MRAVSSNVDTPPGATRRSLSEVEAAVEVSEEQAGPGQQQQQQALHRGHRENQSEPRRLPAADRALYRIHMTVR